MATTTTPSYNPAFFEKISDGSRLSALHVVPELLTLLKPKSVVDIGCGIGAWLSVFREKGIDDILGVDGDYVKRAALAIPQDRFKGADLTQPLKLGRRFDLAISLEVAEHLPAGASETYIDNLAALSDTVVFSAAIPYQGGTHHVNEQWPEYWKVRFEARGYKLIDCLRHRFWNNPQIESWYRQNILLYVKEQKLRSLPALIQELEKNRDNVLSIVHPAIFLAPVLSTILHMIPRTLLRAIRRRLGKGHTH